MVRRFLSRYNVPPMKRDRRRRRRTVVHPIPPARRLSSSERPPPRGIRRRREEGREECYERGTRNPTGSSMRLRDRDGCQKLAYLPSREDATEKEGRRANTQKPVVQFTVLLRLCRGNIPGDFSRCFGGAAAHVLGPLPSPKTKHSPPHLQNNGKNRTVLVCEPHTL